MSYFAVRIKYIMAENVIFQQRLDPAYLMIVGSLVSEKFKMRIRS